MLQIIKQLLREVEYPFVNFNSANLEEIAEIFSLENINVFIKWFIRQLWPSKNLDFMSFEELIHILRNFGFCGAHEVKPFADGTLGFNEQINIIIRLLVNLKNYKNSKKIDKSYTKISFDEIEQFLDSLKIETEYEHIKYTNKERNLHIEEMSNDIEDLKQNVKQLEEELQNEQSLCANITATKPLVDDTSLIKAVSTFQVMAQELEKKHSDMLNNKELSDEPKFSESFTSKLEECVKLSEECLMASKNIGVVKDFNITRIEIPEKNKKEEDFIKRLLPLAEEILNN